MTLRLLTTSLVSLLLFTLIVSGGEGVRLFPIESKNVKSEESSYIGGSSTNRYSVAIKRSGSLLKAGKSVKKKFEPQAGLLALTALPPREHHLAVFSAQAITEANAAFVPAEFARLKPGRAPPE